MDAVYILYNTLCLSCDMKQTVAPNERIYWESDQLTMRMGSLNLDTFLVMIYLFVII